MDRKKKKKRKGTKRYSKNLQQTSGGDMICQHQNLQWAKAWKGNHCKKVQRWCLFMISSKMEKGSKRKKSSLYK